MDSITTSLANTSISSQSTASQSAGASTSSSSASSAESSSTTTEAKASSDPTIACIYCNSLLKHRLQDSLVRCPSCHNVLNVQNLSLDYTNCGRCHNMLCHPHRPVPGPVVCPHCQTPCMMPQRRSNQQLPGTFSGYPGNYNPTTPQYVYQQTPQQQFSQMHSFSQLPVQRTNTFMLNLNGQTRILTDQDIRALSQRGIVLLDPRTNQPLQFVDPQARRRLVELVSALPTWKYSKHEAKTSEKDGGAKEGTEDAAKDAAKDGTKAKDITAEADDHTKTDKAEKSMAEKTAEKTASKTEKDTKSDKQKPLGVNEVDILTDCRICLCDFEDGEELVTLPCLHFFHKDEIYKWLLEDKPVCPMCMNPIMMSS